MHNNARLLSALGSASYNVLLILCTLTLLSCHMQTPNALRIKKINDGEPLVVDIIDVWSYTKEGEVETVEEPIDWYVDVELVYVERGIGLPTYPTSYTARITDYTVTFTNISPAPPGEPPEVLNLSQVKEVCNFLITADPEGKKTVTQSICLIPKEWISQHEGDVEEGRVLRAKITFKGVDEISGKEVSGEGYLTINIANYEDNPNKKGE